jgi:hypothetical protein
MEGSMSAICSAQSGSNEQPVGNLNVSSLTISTELDKSGNVSPHESVTRSQPFLFSRKCFEFKVLLHA